MTPELPTSLLSLLVWSVLVCVFLLPAISTATTFLSWGEQSAPRQRILAEDEWLAIAFGGYHTLALTQDGSVRAWGENSRGQCYVPFKDSFTAIAAGLYHSLALRRDGSIAAWGNNGRGQRRAPTTGRFTAVGAGDWHCLAIQSDGALVAWGWNEYGQCNVPPGERYVAVCGGHSHSLALTTEGTVVAWGNNADGRCEAPEGNDFIAIAAGKAHSLALRSDGSLVAWGYNDDGQCDVPKGGGFVAIAAGALHSLALKEDGSVAAWGRNDGGQCDAPTDCRLAAIMAGVYQSLGIAADVAEDEPVEPCDLAPARAALARLASKALSKVVPAIVSVAESVQAVPVGAAAVVETTPVEEQTPAPLETAVLDGDDSPSLDAEAPVALALAVPPEATLAPSEVSLPTPECDEDIPAGPVAPVEAPIVEERALVTAASAHESVTGQDAEPTATPDPPRSAGAGVVVGDTVVARAGDDREAPPVGRVPTHVSRGFPGMGPVGRNLVITGSIVKIPFLAVGCAGVGLAGASLILFLIRRGFRRWREGKKQRQERQEDVFWRFLLEAGQRQVFSDLDGQ